VLILFGDKMRNRKIMVTFSLVEESQEKTNKELEEEISKELSHVLLPWCKAIERVKVVEE
jgi:RNase P/RNase MRP subunit POP5